MIEVKVTITAPEISQAVNNLAKALAGLNNGAVALGRVDTTQEVAEVQRTEEAPQQKAAECSKTKSTVIYTIEDVRAAFSSYAKKYGKDKAKEILAKYRADKVTSLKQDDYSGVMAEIKE